jgi:hypothetical protein
VVVFHKNCGKTCESFVSNQANSPPGNGFSWPDRELIANLHIFINKLHIAGRLHGRFRTMTIAKAASVDEVVS